MSRTRKGKEWKWRVEGDAGERARAEDGTRHARYGSVVKDASGPAIVLPAGSIRVIR